MCKIVGNRSLRINFHNTESIRIIKLNEQIPGEIGSIECEEKMCFQAVKSVVKITQALIFANYDYWH